MRIVWLTLTGAPGTVPSQADAEIIHDVLWAHSNPETGVVHITTTALPAGIHLAVFLNADVEDPEQNVAVLLSTVSRESAILRHWLGEA